MQPMLYMLITSIVSITDVIFMLEIAKMQLRYVLHRFSFKQFNILL